MNKISFNALKHAYRLRHRNLKRVQERLPTGYRIGPRGRIDYLRNSVTNLFREERVEGTWDYLDETRGYAELILQQSIKNGYDHEVTKEMVDYWIVEKDIIPKLFEVLVPRFEDYDTAYTKLYTLPYVYPGGPKRMGLLELKGNF
ncbi:DgyrCDS6877 [Dimorphilus gyrociliatus]|uniref:Large ribosomal subunit protein bL17m n=1 Tax=Dimorphilus gyrociliatus TaxID=2664684 RepID=A0A7I8VQY6_9ANNE|nr:DgyrCDS6877 [Dimorphilus gyrociliatus]